MKNMTLTNIARACNGRLLYPAQNSRKETVHAEAAGVVIDSRKAGENFIFVATKGERVDGHLFIPDVFAKGALGVVCEKEPESLPGPCIVVEDSFEALKQIGKFIGSSCLSKWWELPKRRKDQHEGIRCSRALHEI